MSAVKERRLSENGKRGGNMTLRHLKIFTVVYQEMSITKASRALHLAQPSVSLAIKELEE